MLKTLGGDRLGAGKKMQVELHGYERSTHDMSYLWRSTMSAGTLVPFMSEVALPGDTFDINLDVDIKTHPTIGPLFGSYKIQLDVFLAPMRLYNSYLHNNMLGIGRDMSKIKIPQLVLVAQPLSEDEQLTADIDNTQINPSCLLAYLGIRGIGWNTTDSTAERNFNAIPYLAYFEIYKNYYANKQEEIGAIIHTNPSTVNETIDNITAQPTGVLIPPSPTVQGATFSQLSTQNNWMAIGYTGAAPDLRDIYLQTQERGEITAWQFCAGQYTDNGSTIEASYAANQWGNVLTVNSWRYRNLGDAWNGEPQIFTFPLANIDQMRTDILSFHNTTTPFVISNTTIAPYGDILDQPNDIPNTLSTQEGLALKTYQSDLFNNWLQTDWIDGVNGITAITAIDTSSGSFTIDTLNLSKKIYDMLNRIAVSGGTYDDWLDAVYTHDRFTKAETPMYMGGLSRELVFQEVVSNSQSADQPLGTLAGKGIMAQKKKGGTVIIKVDEPSYIMGIISLTPRIDYSQGNKWDTYSLKTMDDLHKPALDQIGFQELITEQMAWWDTNWNTSTLTWEQNSAGKQPAWINYMTNTNRVLGNFAIRDNEMFMTLNRRYTPLIEYPNVHIDDLTTYIDPTKFNFIFADTAIDAQNFWAQISVDITARRKMSAKVMPNL